MIVVDTNVIAYMTFPTVHSLTVNSFHERNSLWEVPVLWKAEFLNVVALYLAKGLINYKESLDAIEFAERLIAGREHTVPATEIVNALIRSSCSSYDCEFVVLAERLGTKLVTYDKKVIQDFPEVAITPDAFLTL